MQDPKIAKNLPSVQHRTTLSCYIFATKAHIDNRKKTSSTCPPNMAIVGPLMAEIRFGNLGHPSTFQWVVRLGSIAARHSTPCLKKTSHLWLAITLTHMNGFLIFFGVNVTDKVSNQKTLYYATWNNLCFCTTCQNGETRKSHFSLSWIALHTQCTCVLCAVFLKEKIVICDVFNSV